MIKNYKPANSKITNIELTIIMKDEETIIMKDEEPIIFPPRRLPYKERDIVQKQTED